MKYFLLPLTMLVSYLIAFYGLYFGIIGLIYIFSFNWFWILIAYPFLVGILFGITYGIPNLLKFYILRIYDFKLIPNILHSIGGLIGIVEITIFFISKSSSNSSNQGLIDSFWEESPFKTIILALPAIGLIISIIYSAIIGPLLLSGKDID